MIITNRSAVDTLVMTSTRTGRLAATLLAEFAWRGNVADPSTSNVAPYRIFDMGNEQSIELLRRNAQVGMLPVQADVPNTQADVTKLVRAIYYRPKVSVEAGVAKFVQGHRDYYVVCRTASEDA